MGLRGFDVQDVYSFQERLTQCILDGTGIDGLLCALSSLTALYAVYEGSGLTALLASSPRARELFMTRGEYEGQRIYSVSQTVAASGRTLGTLSLLCVGDASALTEYPDGFLDAVLKLASGFIAIQLTMDKKIAEIEHRLTGNFVEDLISGNYLTGESISGRAKALDYSFEVPHRILVAELQNIAQAARLLNREEEPFRAEFVKKVQTMLDRSSGGLAAYKEGELVILLRQTTGGDDFGPANNLAEDVIREAEQSFRLKMFIGIGDLCLRLEDYRDSYTTAKKALEIGEFMLTEGRVRSFERFRIHALFLSTLKPDELKKYARSQLSRLIDYDSSHKTELVKTLQEFLYLRNNIEGTAKSLNMSVSGLKYRLKQIERILGVELRDNKAGFDLQLAMIILQLFGEYRI